jgi:replicative DNA helicase
MNTKQSKGNFNQNKPTEKSGELFGKMQPQAVDLENAVLGALLIQSDAIYLIMDILKPESFYKPANQIIFDALRNLGINNKPIDIMTVADELRGRKKLEEVGGELYLSELTDRVATSSHLEYHARLVHQKYIQRELIKASDQIMTKAFDESEDVENLINFAESSIFNISEGNIKNETQKIDTILSEALEQITEASKNQNKLIGIPSGFTDIDRYTAGWQPSDLIIIAARPSMGKTAFVLSVARNMTVEHKAPVAIFSLEMAGLQLVNRLISAEAELDGDKIRRGNLAEHEWTQLERKIGSLNNAPLYIDDTAAISIFELRAKCRRLVRTHGVKAVIIDYLQLMTAGMDLKGNREQEVSIISRNLKAIAKELKIPIIALSQLNRSVETRSGDKRPQLSDLRESGAIEQDADMVFFIHRPEYYGITEDSEGNSILGLAEIIIAKHRNGKTGSAWLKFKADYAKFTDAISSLTDFENGNGRTISSKMNEEYNPPKSDLPIGDDFLKDNNEPESPF